MNLAAPDRAFTPKVNWDAGYSAALEAVNVSMLSPTLATDWKRLAPYTDALTPEQFRSLFLPVASRCWNDEQEVITQMDLLAAVRANVSIPKVMRAEMEAILLDGTVT